MAISTIVCYQTAFPYIEIMAVDLWYGRTSWQPSHTGLFDRYAGNSDEAVLFAYFSLFANAHELVTHEYLTSKGLSAIAE
jgi:hypothetical protein